MTIFFRRNDTYQKTSWALPLIALLEILFLASCGGEDEEVKLTEDGLRPQLAEAIKLTEESKFDDAKVVYAVLLTDNPNDLEIMSYFALFSVKSNRHPDAIKYAEAVIEKDPEQALPYVVLSKIEYMGANFKKAVELSRKALKLDPNLGDAYLVIGEIYLLISRYTRLKEQGTSYEQLWEYVTRWHLSLSSILLFTYSTGWLF